MELQACIILDVLLFFTVQICRGAKPVNSYGDVEQVTYDVEIGEQLQSSPWLWLKAYILHQSSDQKMNLQQPPQSKI